MDTQLRVLSGNWDEGYALHKHTLSSVYLGDNEVGRPQFDTTRSEPGEALYQLKYRGNWSKVSPIALEIKNLIVARLNKVGLIIPMPASTVRARQPVAEIANALGKMCDIPVFDDLIVKSTTGDEGPQLKNLSGKDQKIEALKGRLSLRKGITNDGAWNALILDDLFDTGASLETACNVLRSYNKIKKIYVTTVTWK